MQKRVVVDTNVIVAAMKSAGGGTSRAVLRLCLEGRCQPLIGSKLFAEYEDVLARPDLFQDSALSEKEREELLDAFLSVASWIPVFFLWRPNLPDEGDNHVVELAVAGTAEALITHNVRDFRRGELRFPQLRIVTPVEFLRERIEGHGDNDDSDA